MHLGNLSRLSNALSRSISPENFTGEKGKGGMSVDGPAAAQARDLGQGWKISPYVTIAPGTTFTLADIEGQGAIQQIWMTIAARGRLRHCILRAYWDDQVQPSVECPVGDFFACGWEEFAQVSSLAVCVNPGRGFNCYWEMPFRKRARFTLENRGDETQTVYYQINYTLTDVPEDCAYFHAQFRRTNPVPYKQVHTILDGVSGTGHYVGTYMAWGVNNNGWWGEGEIKFYLDGDGEFPTICGTGTEDYFCGAYNFDPHVPWLLGHPGQTGGPQPRFLEYNTPYAGLPQVIRPDGVYRSQQRFGMYRWHIPDPVRFQKDLRVTMQALGWRSGPSEPKYLPLRDDVASVAFWYQTLPAAPFPELPPSHYLEVD
ncbi:glycoside hydrolase family 172 protein [Bradyrhizobium sp.]|uniref:glycoside hydrolase family 172 protein n=1 Tax=Bradyrhizobium sp. TaxID=376 RepID=UPI0025BBFA2F|nr:glycoside hydrolase family 172 protein [Bradyrhizobium sp.]